MARCRSISSETAVITSPQQDATEAGFEILQEGGSAIDAMIAAAAMLCVTTPHMVGIGGDALWLYHDGDKPKSIIGIGQAGHRLPESGKIDRRGPNAIATTAAAVDSWDKAYQISCQRWDSRIPWSRLLEPAIAKARNGFVVTDSQIFWQSQRQGLYLEYPDLFPFWCNESGEPLQQGDQLRLPSLANSLESLGRYGASSFYSGELGAALAEGFAKKQLCLSADDLLVTQAREEDPIQIAYRDGKLYNVAPPSQGITTLQALSILNHFPLEDIHENSTTYYHLMVEAIKSSLKQRNASLRDPDNSALDVEAWLANAANDATAIHRTKAAVWSDVGQPADTAWMADIDANGRSASLIQSIFFDWGSACTIGDTGIIWQNRAAGFSNDAEHPNCWSPGKRPAHTLNPSLYVRNNGERTLFGSQGGDGQPQTQTVLATQLIDLRRSIEDALYAPRFLLGRSFFDAVDNLKIEAHLENNVIQELASYGHEIEIIPELSPLAGLAGVARLHPDGKKEAMHDPRGMSLTLGI